MKRMISICLLLFAGIATWAQDNEPLQLDTFEIDEPVLEKKGSKCVKFHYKVIVPNNSPQLEETCCSLLTGNNDFKTLKEYCSYQHNRYKHSTRYNRYNITRSDYLLVQPVFLPIAERFQTFHISKYYGGYAGGLQTAYTRIHDSSIKENSIDYTVIYDIKEKRVLALDDVFVSDKAKKIEEENDNGFVSMIMGSKTIQYGRNPVADNITRLTYTDIGDQLTESFKKAINFDSLVAEYRLQQELLEKQKEKRELQLAEQKKNQEKQLAEQEELRKKFLSSIAYKHGDLKVSEHIQYLTELSLADSSQTTTVNITAGNNMLRTYKSNNGSRDSLWVHLLMEPAMDKRKYGVDERVRNTIVRSQFGFGVGNQWVSTFDIDVPSASLQFEKKLCKMLFGINNKNMLLMTADKFIEKFNGKKIGKEHANTVSISGHVLYHKPQKIYSYAYTREYQLCSINLISKIAQFVKTIGIPESHNVIFDLQQHRILSLADVLSEEEIANLGYAKKSPVDLAVDDQFLYIETWGEKLNKYSLKTSPSGSVTIDIDGKKLTKYSISKKNWNKFAPVFRNLIGPYDNLPAEIDDKILKFSNFEGIQPTKFSLDLENDASFKGHNDSLLVYLKSQLIIPEEMNPPQRWNARFIVEKDGRVSHVEVKQKESTQFDKFAQQLSKVIEGMPNWEPLRVKGIGAQRSLRSYDFDFIPTDQFSIASYTETKVFDVVEQMPEFPGGAAGLMQYLNDHVKYPAIAEENGIQGRVICQFTVEKDGSINNVRVMRSVDPSLDKEAIRVLKQMPKWIPGKQKGEPVRVNYTVPVQFRLQ